MLKNARGVSNIGHWGTGDVEIALTSMKQFDEVKQLLAAAYIPAAFPLDILARAAEPHIFR